jgi:hypothetical protein
MASKKGSAQVEASTEILDAGTGQVVNGFAAPAEITPAPIEGAMTFEMYCVARHVPVQNRAGMKAFTKRHSATLLEWDQIFKRY